MFNRGNTLEAKREKIIMACLSGGQHIDAALEAADKLVPQSEVDAAHEEDRRLGEEWLEHMKERRIAKNYHYQQKSQPWYIEAATRFWPF